MNKEQLKELLIAEKINRNAFSLYGGLPSEQYVLAETNAVWSVYYSERGLRTSLKEFKTESEACEYFYNWIKDDESAKY